MLNENLQSKEIAKRKFSIMIKRNLLYVAETGRISDRHKKKVEAAEMNAIRISMRMNKEWQYKTRDGYRRND